MQVSVKVQSLQASLIVKVIVTYCDGVLLEIYLDHNFQ